MSIDLKLKGTPIALAVAASLSIVGSPGIQAQQTFSLEEIVITARKVEESLQDVPLSISAFTSEDISEKSIQELEDVALLTPGLSFEDFSNGGFGTPTIRGASQLSITQLEQNVSTFLDGVYIPRQYAVDLGAQGFERIEVVKGPQSALYGANSFMGAINYVSKKANLDEFEADVSVGFGSDERKEASFAVSIPLVQEKLAVRLAGSISEFDGDWENFHPNADAGVSPGSDGNLGGWDNDSYQIGIIARPIDTLTLDLAYHSFDVLSETRAQTRLSIAGGDLNCSPNSALTNVLFCGELPDTPVVPGGGATDTYVETDVTVDPRTYGLDSESDLLRLALNWELSDSMELIYQYAEFESEVYSAGASARDQVNGDFIFIPFVISGIFTSFTNNPIGSFEYDSHELRLDSATDSGLTYTVGAFYSKGDDTDDSGGALLDVGGTEPVTEENFFPIFARGAGLTTTETQAIFGRVEMPLLEDSLRLSAEARYTDEEKEAEIRPEDPYNDSYFTARLSADYQLAEDVLTYASIAQGVKSGGINASTIDLTRDEENYGPDENTTYEIGYKGTLVDGRLQLNTSVYYIDWSDLQISIQAENAGLLDTPILDNIGSATSVGFESDVIFAVTEALTLNAGLSYNDATYDSGVVSQRIRATGDDGLCYESVECDEDGDVGGNTLPRAPETQWNIGAQYDGTVDNLDYFLRADFAGQSKMYVSELNVAEISSRELLNLRGGISMDNWSVEIWMKNAMDEEYVSNAFFIATDFGVDYVPTYGNKRQYGLTLDYAF